MYGLMGNLEQMKAPVTAVTLCYANVSASNRYRDSYTDRL